MWTIVLFIILLIVNIPIYKMIFKKIFKSTEDFKESVKYSFTPDLFSLFNGRFWKDQIGEAKLSFFIFACVLVIVLEFFIVKSIAGLIT